MFGKNEFAQKAQELQLELLRHKVARAAERAAERAAAAKAERERVELLRDHVKHQLDLELGKRARSKFGGSTS